MSEENDPVEEDEVDTSADDAGGDGGAAEDTEGEDTAPGGDEDSEADDSAADGDAETPPAKSSRANERLTKVVKERNELRERAIRAEALAEERANTRQTPAANPAEAQRARDEKLALMDPTERREFEQHEKMQNMEQQILLTQLQTQDALDKNSFAMTARQNPVFAKHAGEVERRLTAERRAGRNWARETILAQILGEAALKAKPDNKKKDEARQRVDSSRAAAPSGRSNVNGYRAGRANESFDDLERRLENVSF